MQDEQKKFQEKLSELLSYARDHENKVTMKEVRDFFEDFALDEQKVRLEQKLSEPMVNPMPLDFALRRLA